MELQEFEIELEGSQTLRILCYEKCYNKTKITKEDGENTDRIVGKGQVQVRLPPASASVCLPVQVSVRPHLVLQGISVQRVSPAGPRFLKANVWVVWAAAGSYEAGTSGKSTNTSVHPNWRPLSGL